MNEEEKKAIKSMKRFVECKQDMTAVTASEMKTVLNLLEKKDRTIQQLKDENRTLNRQSQQYFEQGIKKDKIINELEDIFYNYQLCEYELTDCTYRKCEYIADDENPPCKECIKQYFERKVENGN